MPKPFAAGVALALPTVLVGPLAARAESLDAVAATARQGLESGDTGWVLVSAALVLMMTPALALFYGGFVRGRNVLNTMMMSLITMAVVSVTWVLFGYSLAFAPGNAFLGGLQWAGMSDWSVFSAARDYMSGSLPHYGNGTLNHYAFALFQCTFAIITPALISGAIVERVTFRAWFWFILLWSTFIYLPLVHMVWGADGFLGMNGSIKALDFAGGLVVEIASGVSAAVAAWVIGPRRSYAQKQLSPPHNVVYILLGAGLLWFGWFGFNGGSALASGASAGLASVTTNVCGATAALVWCLIEWKERGNPTAVGLATGAVAGLVGITPCAGFVTPLAAIAIGALVAIACYYAVELKSKWRFDDSLDVMPVHGVAGTVGMLLLGLFATRQVAPAGADGLFYGNPEQFLRQLAAVAFVYLFVGVGTFAILKILGRFMRLRLSESRETQGLDINAHGEEAYNSEFSI
jgi:Amt family ammonium transporter